MSKKKFAVAGILAAVLIPVAATVAFVLIVVLGAVSAVTQQGKGGVRASCVINYVGGSFANPLVGQLTSNFGPRPNPFGAGVIPPGFTSEDALTFHDGQDIAGVQEGTPFFSASAGKVKTVFGPNTPDGPGDGGNGIIIDAGNGVEFWYWHAVDGSAKVRIGDEVKPGQELAAVGHSGASTATHLHFQINVNNKPVDPVAWMAAKGVTLGPTGAAPAVPAGNPSNGPTPSAEAGQEALTTEGPGGSMVLTKEQMTNASTIRNVGLKEGATNQDLKIAFMVALQESTLRVLTNKTAYPESALYPNQGDGGDHDSLGFFQQRPAAGWGTVAQLMDPVYSARAFFGGLTGPNRGSPRGLFDLTARQQLSLGEAGQLVQGSAYPFAYDKWSKTADAILTKLGGRTPGQCDNATDKDSKPAGNVSQTRQEIIAAAKKGLGGTYIWGGTQFKAWDCSGYVKWVYEQAGKTLPRVEQWKVGSQTNAPEPGDLVVQIPDSPGHWTHVGIYAGDGMMYSALNPGEGTLLHPVSWNPGTAYFNLLKS